IFMEKYRRFSPDLTAAEVRVPLTHNFRCRQGIIYVVNHVFERIVVPALGNIYGSDAALTYGADYPPLQKITDIMPVEVHLLEKDTVGEDQGDDDDATNDSKHSDNKPRAVSVAEQTAIEREAFVVGTRISQLLEQKMPVWDVEQKCYRPVRYRD